MEMSKKQYYKYPIRTCMTLHHCAVCHTTISAGQKYFDGGWDRRSHILCGCSDVEELSIVLEKHLEGFCYYEKGNKDATEARRAVAHLVLDAIAKVGVYLSPHRIEKEKKNERQRAD